MKHFFRVGQLGLALLPALLGSASASGQQLYGLTVGQKLVSFTAAAPGTYTSVLPITGITAGQTLVGMDVRPATGELFVLGYDQPTTTARLYTVNPTTGAATAVGAGAFAINLGAESAANVGFDFNPVVDRIRVVTADANANYRLNPITGTLVFTDGSLAYAPGDTYAGRNPNVGSVAYTNSYLGATSTILYDGDLDVPAPPAFPFTSNVILSIQEPNSGVLTTLRDSTQDKVVEIDMDIYSDLATGNQTGYIAARYWLTAGGAVQANLLGVVNLQAGTIAAVGPIGPVPNPDPVVDLAARIDRTAPALVGPLAYALSSNNNLLTFDAANPSFIRASVPVTGLTAGQTLVGMDVRPATGQLYAMGYNSVTGDAQLYTLNPATGAATVVAAPVVLDLGTGAVGFDFNPTVDRIRVVGANDRNYRLNPISGALAATDLNLAYAAGDPNFGTNPAVGAVGYTNSVAGASTTTLYDIDEALSILARQVPPNNGTLNTVNSLGISLNPADPTNDLDVYSTTAPTPVNTAYLAASTGTSLFDRLYTVDLGTGAATLVGNIGGGISVRDIALVLPPVSAFVWTGAVSTDWATAGNWATNAVPTAADDAVIPAGAPRYPEVSGTQTARNVTVNGTATLTLLAASTFNLNGNLVNNGTVSGNATSTLRLAGAGTQTLGGSAMTMLGNLTVGAAGGQLDGAAGGVQVARLLTLSGNLATNGRPLTLLSDATATAMVVNSGGAVTGAATVQRYITPGSVPGVGYRHMSAPVSNTTFADLTTPQFTPVVNGAYNTAPNPLAVQPYPNIFGFDETRFPTSSDFSKGYFSPTAASDPMVQGRGYTVYMVGTSSPDFVGTLGNGNVVMSNLTRTGAFPASTQKSGWHLLGNPYPSPINWDLATIPAGMSPTISVFRTSGGTNGTYTQYTNGVGPANTDILPAAQAFFARVTGAGPVTFTFTNAMRLTTYSNPAHYRSGTPTADQRPLLHLTLAKPGAVAEATDAAYVYFQDGATAGMDDTFDADKLRAEGDVPSIFTVTDGRELAINGLPTTAQGATTVPLGVVLPSAGTYELTVAALRHFAPGAPITLLDRVTGTRYDLSRQATVTFSTTATGAQLNRFSLEFGKGATVAPLTLALDVYPNPVNTGELHLSVVGVRAATATAVLTDVLGRTVATYALPVADEHAAATLDVRKLTRGTYTLRLLTDGAAVLSRQVSVE